MWKDEWTEKLKAFAEQGRHRRGRRSHRNTRREQPCHPAERSRHISIQSYGCDRSRISDGSPAPGAKGLFFDVMERSGGLVVPPNRPAESHRRERKLQDR